MATLNLAVTADTIGDVPLQDGLETQINTALSTLLTNNVFAAQYLAQDQQRRAGQEYNVLVTYSSVGATTLTSPFQVRVFQAASLSAAKTLQTTFCDDNPTFFFGTSTFQNLNVIGNDKPFSIIQFYSEDATGGAQNWQADQGGSMTAGVTTWNGRVGVVVPALNDYAASLVNNDSSVTGTTVKDALETLAAASGVVTWNSRTGAVVPVLNDYAASLINNDSTVSGSTVENALDTLATAAAPGGSGTEIQYRSGAASFGGVPSTSWDGSILTIGNSVRLTGASPTLNVVASSGESAFLRLGEDLTTPIVLEFDGSGGDKGLHIYGTTPGKATSLLIERDTNRVLVRDGQNATSLSTGAFQVTAGGASFAQDLYVGGIITIRQTAPVLDIISSAVNGSSSILLGENVTTNTELRYNGSTDQFEIYTGMISPTLRMAITRDSGQIKALAGISSVSTVTGTVVVTGGQGISENLHVGGNATLAGMILGGITVTDILISSDGASTSDGVLVTAGYVDAHGGSGTGEAITKDITQATHGFIVGDWLRLSAAGVYTKAQANNSANAEVVGRVSVVPGLNDFTLTMEGYVTGMPAVAANTGFVLDPSTAGAMTSTAPSVNGQINRFLFRSDDTTTGYVQILRGVEVGDPAFTSVANATAANLLWKSDGLNRVLVETAITELSGGNVGIGTASPSLKSILDLTSTTLGFLPPRMTEAQRDAITSPTDGLKVHNTTLGRPEYFNNLTSTWSAGASGASAIVFVRSIADLPTPAGSVITLAANTCYQILKSFNTDGNQIKFGAGTEMEGISSALSVITGTTAVALITADGTAAMNIRSVGFVQAGAGDVLDLTTGVTASTRFIGCGFSGAPVRLVSGGFAGFINCTISGGAQIIQDAAGGVTNFSISDNSVLFDSGAIDGVVLFETGSGSAGSVFIMRDAAVILLSASVGIRIEAGVTIGDFEIINSRLGDGVAGATGIIIEDPDDVNIGSLNELVFTNAGTKLACEPASSSNFASPDADPRDVGFDGTNLLSCDPSTAVNGSAYLHTGVSSSITTTLTNAVFDDVRSVSWARGNLLSIVDDGASGLIQIHDGFSVTVDDSFASPAANPVGITFDGTNIISLDNTSGVIYIHDQQTATILTSFASPAGTDSSGIAYNGINILVSDSANNLIYVLDRSGVVKYSFAGPGTLASGITTTDVGAVVSDVTATAAMYVFNHHITFDHSAATWSMIANEGLTDSADRGGSIFETSDPLTGISLAVTQNVWRDIDDGGTSIFYGSFQELEKCHLNNEENGEIIWESSRDRGQLVSAIATFSRGGGGGDTAYELAVVINGVIERDSVILAVLATGTEFKTMMTIPITRDLTATDTIKVQIRNLTNTNAPEFVTAKVAIN